MKATNKMNIHQKSLSKTSTLRTLVGVLAMSAALSGSISAATIVSNDFSFGYGKNSASGSGVIVDWTLQPSSSNTPTTQGLFTLTPTIRSAAFSEGGPLFTDRTITTTGGTTPGANSGYSGNSANFTAAFNFSYTGPIPVDAAPTPNLRISLIIDSISIWGVRYNSAAGDTLAFGETTLDHTATSPTITLNNVASPFGNLNQASPYLQLVWNPVDYSVDGDSGFRSFNLVSQNGRAVDGFEVFGRVELTYDAIPEPSTIALGVIGLTTLLFFRKRRQSA